MSFRKCIFLTFFTSLIYAIAAYFLVSLYFLNSPRFNEARLLAAAIYMWIPGAFALFFAKREKLKLPIFQKPTKYVIPAILVPVLITFIGIFVNLLFAPFSLETIATVLKSKGLNLFSSTSLNVSLFMGYMVFTAALAACTINFLFALGEELLWRGYLWEKIKCLGFYKGSGIIGLLWGLWHAPIIILFGHNYPEHRLLGILLMTAFCVLSAPIYTYLRIKDNSLMAPTIFHGMTNAFIPLAFIFFPSGKNILLAPLGFGGLIALAIVNLYFFRNKKREELNLNKLAL